MIRRSSVHALALRLAQDESGFTLIELLNVTLIISILVAVALPSYLNFRDNAYKQAVGSDTKGIVIAAGLYAADNFPGSKRDPDAASSTSDTGYSGMTMAELRAFYDAHLSATGYVNHSGSEASGVTTRATLDATHFCVYAQAGRWFGYQLDTGGPIMATTDPAAVCT